ncbi:PadR family transcriptional regulator [Streptomyces sp. RB6PN25]|uniref:PadR family transcriptional regulator n=1 Tax=Streptomyces humicola TaxID=2953240 RepID=A0ABT1Q5K9_9ACTN|nr:PadR family transcriptional regulator [Streptomyces humicola]MCQ4085206.1 PadR family transcriptional regulator [Streptomyces humicola]
MAKQKRDSDGLARFGEPGLLVLLALSDGPKHGYAITADVAERTGIQLGPGTLYGSMAKLEKLGLIAALQSEDRRRPYEITAAGRAALVTQLQRWSRIVETGRTRLAWT